MSKAKVKGAGEAFFCTSIKSFDLEKVTAKFLCEKLNDGFAGLRRPQFINKQKEGRNTRHKHHHTGMGYRRIGNPGNGRNSK